MTNNSSARLNGCKHSRIIIFLLIAVLILLTWEVSSHFIYKKNLMTPNYDRSSLGLDLINPKVVKYKLPDIGYELKAELFSMIEKLKSENKISDLGLYVRDLNSGYGFGVNENEKFIPASLLKIISMISYYKLSESDPEILEKTLVYKGPDYNSQQTFKPTEEMIIGQSYTVDDLIKRSVSYSDNNANAMLVEDIDTSEYKKIFAELGIDFSTSSSDKSITPKVYSNLFRILYNSTFLNQTNSQKALSLLEKSNFTQGIEAGLNGNVKLANKFGERSTKEDGKNVSYLHDCGVVYAKYPYVLCVMTKGDNIESLQQALADVSSVIYRKLKY